MVLIASTPLLYLHHLDSEWMNCSDSNGFETVISTKNATGYERKGTPNLRVIKFHLSDYCLSNTLNSAMSSRTLNEVFDHNMFSFTRGATENNNPE